MAPAAPIETGGIRPGWNYERAAWQRSVGAVLMRELTAGAFDTSPIESIDLERIWNYASSSYKHTYSHEGLNVFWATAQYTSEMMIDTAFTEVDNNIADLRERDTSGFIENELMKNTYYGEIDSVIREAKASAGNFPISLARSICKRARQNKIDSDRYTLRSFDDLASLLDSPDVRLMVDQSLVAANGFWRGFSTGVNSLATTGFLMSPYEFADEKVMYTQSAIKTLRTSVKQVNNRTTSYTGFSAVRGSSSGCPARHLWPTFNEEDAPKIEALGTLFGKSAEEVLVPHPDSVVQAGLTYMVGGLRAINGTHQKWMQKYEERLQRFPMNVPEDYLY